MPQTTGINSLDWRSRPKCATLKSYELLSSPYSHRSLDGLRPFSYWTVKYTNNICGKTKVLGAKKGIVAFAIFHKIVSKLSQMRLLSLTVLNAHSIIKRTLNSLRKLLLTL